MRGSALFSRTLHQLEPVKDMGIYEKISFPLTCTPTHRACRTVSADPSLHEECFRGAKFLLRLLEGIGAEVKLAQPVEDKNPVVLGRIGRDPSKPTVTFYGAWRGGVGMGRVPCGVGGEEMGREVVAGLCGRRRGEALLGVPGLGRSGQRCLGLAVSWHGGS